VSETQDLGTYRMTIRKVRGQTIRTTQLGLAAGVHVINVPAAGLVSLAPLK
jgi:hypothetical protein